MNMKKKIIALAAATIIAAQAFILPVGAANYFVSPSNGTDYAAAPGLPLQMGNPWLFKGSAGEHKEVLEEDADGTKFYHCESDSIKQGTPGEGSWYLYTRKNSGLITDKGFMKFDIRLNSGIIKLNIGSYGDPTKGVEEDGVGKLAAELTFDGAKKSITATAANGKVVDVVDKFKMGEWYTVRVDIDHTNLEYKVTVTDKSGKESKTDTLSYVHATADAPRNFIFAYVRKQNGHNFDFTNYSVATGEYSEAEEKAALAALDAPAASAEPSAAPDASAAPAASAAPETSAAPSASTAPEASTAPAKKTKIELVIDNKEAKVDGAAKELDAAPVIVDDRTLVPVRFISENMGGKVDWDAATRTVTIELNGKKIQLVIDSKDVDVDGTKTALDVPAQIISDRTYVPVRFVSETIGATVGWDAATKTVTIEQ